MRFISFAGEYEFVAALWLLTCNYWLNISRLLPPPIDTFMLVVQLPCDLALYDVLKRDYYSSERRYCFTLLIASCEARFMIGFLT